ncbi:MAG: response regulator [Bacteroidota bacterium]
MQAKRILIVENDIITTNIIENFLKESQCDFIRIASDSGEAISFAKEIKPDLILMNISLEGEFDGIQIAEAILKINDAPVLFIASSSDEKTISRLMKTEPNGFIIKPFEERILRSAIDIAIYRHKSKTELFEAKEILRCTLESIDDIVISLDEMGIVTHVHSRINKDKSAVFDTSKLIGEPIISILPTDSGQIFERRLNRLIRTEEVQEYDFGIPEKKPEKFFNIKASLRKDQHQQISGITLVIRDITSKVSWAETLRKFSAAVEQSANIVIIFNKDGFVEFVNNQYIKTSGYTYEDNVGKRFRNFNPVENNEKLLDDIWEHIIEGKVWEGEWENRRKDGSTYWEHVTISPIKDDNGILTHFLLVSVDITQKRQIQQELVSSRERLEEAQQISGLGSCVIDFKTNKIVSNEMFCKILGIKAGSLKEFDGDFMLDYIHAEDQDRYKSYKAEIINNQRNRFSLEFRIADKNSTNELKYVHSIGKMEYTEDGEPLKMFLTIQDISLQKYSDKLLQDIEIARKTANIKQQFFANISHEIRNPLSNIVGLSDVLLKSKLSSEQEQMAKNIMFSADTILNLVNDILDISRIEAGKMNLVADRFSIYEMLENAKLLFEPQAQAKGLSLSFSIPGNLPSDIISDEKRIMQVISNLLGNAIKFTEEGFVKLNVSLVEKIAEEDYIIKIEVVDSGIGVEEKDQPKLFKSFSQIHTEIGKKATGSGLGLSICKHFTDMLGGEIGVESKPGEGSCFWFTFRSMLMKDVPEKNPNEIVEDELLNSLDLLDIKGSSILLVEDKVVNQKVISLMLNKLGCSCAIANNGKQALELFQESEVNAFDIFGKIKYDLILMDVKMPEIDGVEVTGLLKSNYPNIPPIIGLTANVNDDDIVRYKEAGMDDVLAKPVKLDVLERKLSYWLSMQKKKVLREELEGIDSVDIDKLPILNPNTLKAITKQFVNSEYDIVDIFNSFIDDMESIYKKWIVAIEMNDYHSLKMVVMTVKGLSGNIGASQMHETARQIDKYLKAGLNQKASDMMPRLAEKYEAFKTHIKVNYISKRTDASVKNKKRN